MTTATTECWEIDSADELSAEVIPASLRQRRSWTWGGRQVERKYQFRLRVADEPALPFVDEWFSGYSVVIRFGLVPPPIGLSRTFGGRSFRAVGGSADPWDLTNRRRLFLIDKKFQTGLSQTEEGELDALQIDYGAYLDAIQPPPFDKLEELEALARQLNPTRALALP